MNTEKKITGGKPTAIVYGPQGCGKSLHGAELARHFGVKNWGDLEEIDVRNGRYMVPPRDHLLFHFEDPSRYTVRPAGVRVVRFIDATNRAGINLPPILLSRALGDPT